MLIIGLPDTADTANTDAYEHARFGEDARLISQGLLSVAEWPAGPLVAVLPLSRLSWHSVRLPDLPKAQRLPAVIGLLEDQWLQSPASLHLSLHPIEGAAPDQPNFWVCACDAQWLDQALQALIDAYGDAAVLKRADLQHLSIANPKLAPYGAAGLETLKKLGLYDAWQPRIVQGENITQAHQFVASGNVPLGFVALSQVFENGRIASGSAWIVPKGMHAPIRQDAVLLKKGMSNPAAQAFLQFLRSDEAKTVIRAHGYELE